MSGNKVHRSPAFWISVVRGSAALILGISLLFAPEKSQTVMANFMGVFWVTVGIALLKRDRRSPFGQRTAQVMGAITLIAGLLVVARGLFRQWLPEAIVIQLLGLVIVLTGLLHVMGQYRGVADSTRRRRITHGILGIAEIALGLTLFLSPLDRSTATYFGWR